MLLQMTLIRYFSWLGNIPLHICTTYSLFHFSIDGHLGCFHVLATLNSTAMNIEVHIFFFKLWFSLHRCPGVGLLGHMVVLFLVF